MISNSAPLVPPEATALEKEHLTTSDLVDGSDTTLTTWGASVTAGSALLLARNSPKLVRAAP
jgi:hypothetical protein